MFFISAASIFFLIIIGLGITVYKKAPALKVFFTAHPLALKAFVWIYIVFNACFSFPIGSERFPLDFSKAYLLIVSYGVIAFSFAHIYAGKKRLLIWAQTLFYCALGLICRYFLEYGEVSNSYNFTPINTVAYLIVIPLYTVSAYMFLDKRLRK